MAAVHLPSGKKGDTYYFLSISILTKALTFATCHASTIIYMCEPGVKNGRNTTTRNDFESQGLMPLALLPTWVRVDAMRCLHDQMSKYLTRHEIEKCGDLNNIYTTTLPSQQNTKRRLQTKRSSAQRSPLS